MDLQKELDKSGYTRAVKDLENAKGMRNAVKAGMHTATRPEVLPQLRKDLADLEAWIENAEAKLAEEYAAAVKYVDANNDAYLAALQIEEIAELVAEELDKTDPAAGEKARAIMRGERP